jgi:hypothetical protein
MTLTLKEVEMRQEGVKRWDQSRMKDIAFFTSPNCAVSAESAGGTFCKSSGTVDSPGSIPDNPGSIPNNPFQITQDPLQITQDPFQITHGTPVTWTCFGQLSLGHQFTTTQ